MTGLLFVGIAAALFIGGNIILIVIARSGDE